MESPQTIAKFTLPLGKEQVELGEIRFDADSMPMLRIRIKEGKRFTVFDVDPVNAAAWAEAMQKWAAGVIKPESSAEE